MNGVSSVDRFRVYCPLMMIYSILAVIFVGLSIAGVKLPFDIEAYESTAASQIVSAIGAVLSVIGAFVGMSALKNESNGAIKFCAVIGFVVVVSYCASMVLANGHTNPHIWAIFGSIGIIPGLFSGAAIRVATKGWNS